MCHRVVLAYNYNDTIVNIKVTFHGNGYYILDLTQNLDLSRQSRFLDLRPTQNMTEK